MDKDKEFLGTEKIGKLLFRLAVPTVIAQIVNMLYNIVDRIYIGHIPGEGSAALTGVGVCMPIIMIISAFAALVSAGGAPRASISLGKGDKDGAEKILGGCFLLQLILSVVLTAVLLIWDRKLLLMFGASENTIDYAAAYMDIYAVGTIFVQLTLGLNAFITAQGFAKTGMLTVIIGAEKILGSCFLLQLILSVMLTAVLLIWDRKLLLMFGASENTIDYAAAYMDIYAVGTIFVQLTLGLNAFITAQGFAKTGMLTVIIGAAANIVLDPLFIFVFNMGVRGAAVATVISQGVSCVWAVCFLLSKKTGLKIRLKNMRLSLKIIMPCIALGLATFIMQASESVISVCFNSSLLKYGGDIAVGAMTILTSVMQFAMLPLQGIGQGAQPIMSYNYGARNPDRVKKTYRLLLIVNMIYAVILWAAVIIFPKAFAGIFSSDSELVGFAAKALRIYLGGMFLMGAQIACQMAFVSIGNAPCSIIVAVVRKFVLLIPLIYIMPHIISDKAIGVYTAEPIADVLAVTFTLILFAFRFRSAMKKLEKPEAAEK